jgi:hypothetical protein
MDLCLVQIDGGILQIINRATKHRVLRMVQREVMWIVQRRVMRTVQRMQSRYRGLPLVLGTVEYPLYTRFMDLGIHVNFLPHHFEPEMDTKLYGQAQEFAQDLAAKVGARPDLLFRGVNLFEIIINQLTIQFLIILRIGHFVKCRAAEPGVIVILTGLQLAPASELPVRELVQIGNRKVVNFVRSISRSAIGSYLTRGGSDSIRSTPINFSDTGSHAKRILFVATDNGSTNWAEPLIFVLEKMKGYEDMAPFVVVDDSFTAHYLEERGFQCTKYSQFNSREAEFHWSKSEPAFRRSTLELVQKHGGTIQGLMVSTFLQCYLDRRLLSGIYSRVLWLDNVVGRLRPDAVVIFALISNIGMVASRIARIHHVPTLSWVGTWPHGTKPHPEFRLYDATDLVAGYGEELNRTLAASGLNPDKIIPVGNPKFDSIPQRSTTRIRNYVRARCGAKKTKHIFLVATYLFTPGSREWIRALARQLKKLEPEVFKLVIKPHPDEGPEEYRRILEEEQFTEASIVKDIPLYALLDGSDIVFTGSSTVGSEAVLFNKPLICINLTNTQYAVRYDKEGVALLVEREEEILSAIDNVLHSRKVIRDLRRARKRVQGLYALGLDGRSSDRFVNAIKKVTGQ